MNGDSLLVFFVFGLCVLAVLLTPIIFGQADGQLGDDDITEVAFMSLDVPRYHGLWLQVHNNDPGCPFEDYVREIADAGADTICITVSAHQENASSSDIFIDQRTAPSRERLTGLFELARSLKLRIVFMPIVLLESPRQDEWRGKINPTSWDDWWLDYTKFILLYAQIAQGNGVEMFLVGSELNSTEKDEARWRRLIAAVRAKCDDVLAERFRHYLNEMFPGYSPADYKSKLGLDDLWGFTYRRAQAGSYDPELVKLWDEFDKANRLRLCYSANWDRYQAVKWWDALDAAGMTTYYNLNKPKEPDPSVEDMKEAWGPIKDEIARWQRTVGKPVIFTEVGWASQDGCSIEPWNYYHSETVDLAEQDRCMDSFLQTFGNEDWAAGVLVWKWRDHPNMVGGADDTSYTPRGKPVLKTIQRYFAGQRLAAANGGQAATSRPDE